MPMSMTHTYIAKDVYKDLDKRVKNKITLENLNDYLVYSKGFDILFFYMNFCNLKLSKKIQKLGSLCQESKTNEYLINLIEKVKVTKNTDQFLYLSGLITHYVADSAIHPFINYLARKDAKNKVTPKDCHFMIESYIDNYLIREREKGDYWKFKVYDKGCFKIKENKEVKDLLETSFQEVFNVSNVGDYYYNGLKHMYRFFRYLRHDVLGIKRVFYLSVNFLAKRLFRDVSYLSYHFKLDNDIYYLNLNHDKWFNILDNNITSNENVLDLYKKVVSKSIKMIEGVYDYIFLDKKVDLDKLLENKSYSTGLILK